MGIDELSQRLSLTPHHRWHGTNGQVIRLTRQICRAIALEEEARRHRGRSGAAARRRAGAGTPRWRRARPAPSAGRSARPRRAWPKAARRCRAPSTCCTRLSPTAMPPVTARCAATTARSSRKKPKKPGPAAIDLRHAPHEPQRLRGDEQQVDSASRRNRGHDRHPPRRTRPRRCAPRGRAATISSRSASRTRSAPSMMSVCGLLEPRPRAARSPGARRVERHEIGQHGAPRLAVVGGKHRLGPRLQRRRCAFAAQDGARPPAPTSASSASPASTASAMAMPAQHRVALHEVDDEVLDRR